ncbi:MAG: C25 family cysteine peptidase, partial [Bdellovibrionia bacterium]
ERRAHSGTAEVFNKKPDTALTLTGFTPPGNNVSVYDISRRGNRVSLLSNVQFSSPDGGTSFNARFAGRLVAEDTGRYFMAVADGSYLEPQAIVLNYGAEQSLRHASRGADLIIIGSRQLLDAGEELAAHRRSSGMRVAEVPLHQIFAEFGHGRASTQSIKDFVAYALDNWQAPAPKYLLLLGDSTYDPKNRLSYGSDPSAIPIPIQEGMFLDFGNDHWFVADSMNLPRMAVGRLPTSKPNEIENYVSKVINYENGTAAPANAAAAQAVFVSDSDSMSEDFGYNSDGLAVSMKAAAGHFSTQRVTRAGGTDAQAKSNIIGQFNAGPLMMTYLGHGASDRWAGANVFTTADATALENERLPIVTALNCMNSYFYDADPDEKSLAEALVLNPDGGAIAFWGSTGMTAPPVQVNLEKNFINEIGLATTQAAHDVRLGDLMLRSKVSLGNHASSLDTLRSYSLIGDPSLKLPAASFHAPETEEQPAPPTSGSGGGGIFGCGTTGDGTGSGGFGFGLEMILYAIAFMFIRNFAGTRPPLNSTNVGVIAERLVGPGFWSSSVKLTPFFALATILGDPTS